MILCDQLRKSIVLKNTLVSEKTLWSLQLNNITEKHIKAITAWKVSKYGVISGQYFPVFELNTGKYGPEITPYLDIFHEVFFPWFFYFVQLTFCGIAREKLLPSTVFQRNENIHFLTVNVYPFFIYFCPLILSNTQKIKANFFLC